MVARELLGQRLVRLEPGGRLAGLITETEAYVGQDDLACHARFGRTPRSEVMFGLAGFAYVYFTYGMHWMLNVVTEAEGFPAAVLIRGMLPVAGEPVMRARRAQRQGPSERPTPLARLTDGPAKLAQAMALNENDHRLFTERALFATRLSKRKPGKEPEPEQVHWRDRLLKTLLPPESPVEKMILDSIRVKANIGAFASVH